MNTDVIRDTPYIVDQGLMTIKSLCALYKSGDVKFPKWQREDDWPKDYQEKLVVSVLNKMDIPKIYLAKINGESKIMVLDGGHRLRAFLAFTCTEKPLSFRVARGGNQKQVYYGEPPSTTSLCLDDIGLDKSHFDNYKLIVVTYNKVTEEDARNIFNVLQNQRPMTIAECINSIASPLVDYLRGHDDITLDSGESVGRMLNKITRVKTENHKYMLHLLSIWNMVKVESGNDSKKINALKNCRTSKNVVDDVKRDTLPLVQEDKENFDKMINIMDNVVNDLSRFKLPKTDIFTVAHYAFYENVGETPGSQNEFNDKTRQFFKTLATYKQKKSEAEKESKKKSPNMDIITSLKQEIKDMDEHNLFQKFHESHDGGSNWGIGPSGMKDRYEVLSEYLT